MSKQNTTIKAAIVSIIALGAATLIVSTFLISSFFAILGFSLIFWGVILLYITPSTNPYLSLLSATIKPGSDNIERILTEYNLSQPGIYLPTENIAGLFGKFSQTGNNNSILVFIPEKSNISSKNVYPSKTNISGGLYVTPPGQTLCQMFEQYARKPFSQMNLLELKIVMSIILTKDLKLAETIDIQRKEDLIIIEITKSVFELVCQETNNQPKTHKLVGCLLTSALACALVKVTGKPIIIRSESLDAKARKTKIEYQILINTKD